MKSKTEAPHSPAPTKPLQPTVSQMMPDFISQHSSADTSSVPFNFNGNYEDAANHYYKEVNRLCFANMILNNQVTPLLIQMKAVLD